MSVQHSMIQGKLVPYTPMRLPIEKIWLDPTNPRVQYLVGQAGGGLTQERLDELLWEKDQVKALAQSILQNGGVREPIIVQAVDEAYVVREGNCRTVSCRHLADQHPGDERFSSIPAHVYHDVLTEEDLAVVLADLHVAKKISWDAYEQAKHIHDLFTIHGKTYDWLSNHLRLSKGKIAESLKAYKAATDYLSVSPDPANVRKFSFFHELMKKRELREQFEESGEFRNTFYRWLDENRITDARQVRSLPSILASPDALRSLNEEGIEAASKVLIHNDPSLGSGLFHAVKVATEALNAAPMSDIQDLREGNPQKLIMIRNLKRALEDLSTMAGVQF